jgi:LAO/AO transport system kinase
MSTPSKSNALLTRLLDGELAALARAITMIDNELPGHTVFLETVPDKPRTTPVVGFTGAPGVGKSTLINAYTAFCRSVDRRVAIVSIDPSSPISGGAILGDRLRMAEHAHDDGVYIRSLASRGHLGGLCRNIDKVIQVIDTAGWDVIVLETVGTGQSEVEVASIANVKVVVNAPGMGDSIQAMKSGILEIADILVVNKADLPQAGQTTKELRAMLRLRSNSMTSVAVIETVATSHTGIDELSAAIDDRNRSGE